MLCPATALGALPASGKRLAALREQMDEMADVRDTIARGIADDPPALPSEPGVIRRGFHAELDELTTSPSAAGRSSRRWRSASGSAPESRR